MADDPVPWAPMWVMRPGVHLREMMDDGHVSSKMIAKIAGLPVEVIDGVLDGTVEITENVAKHLARGVAPLTISARFWLNLERHYREGLARGLVDISDD